MLARHNKQNGRASGSRVDLQVYCPPDALQVGGPLFGDTEAIQESYNLFMEHKLVDVKLSICKCVTCGFPDCSCNPCASINAARKAGTKTKAKGKHTCALQHVACNGGAPPKAGFYDIELSSHLTIAWQEKGIPAAPVFSKKCGKSGYFWPEEVTGIKYNSQAHPNPPSRAQPEGPKTPSAPGTKQCK